MIGANMILVALLWFAQAMGPKSDAATLPAAKEGGGRSVVATRPVVDGNVAIDKTPQPRGCCAKKDRASTGTTTARFVNASCPISGQPIGDGAIGVSYNGFTIGLCSDACKERFRWWSSRDVNAFLGRYVQPTGTRCAVVGCCLDCFEASRVSYHGQLLRMCCPSCLAQWKDASDEQRLAWYTENVLHAGERSPASIKEQSEAMSLFGSSMQKPLSNADLVSLEENLDPLLRRFNSDSEKLRLVAILSPSCGGCTQGAWAIIESVLEGYPSLDVSVSVVWVPEWESDSAQLAAERGAIFMDSRVRHFWDPQERTGRAFSKDSFAGRFRKMAGSLPSHEPMAQRFTARAKLPPESTPLRDFAAFFRPGVKWNELTPRPAEWVRSLYFWGGRSGDDPTGTLWRNTFGKPPIDSSWFAMLADSMLALTGKEPSAGRSATSLASTMTGFTGGVPRAASPKIGRTSRCVRIPVSPKIVGDEKAPVTKYAKPCCGKKTAAKTTMANAAKSDVAVLSESIEPLRDYFNAHKDKHRFIAILSPT